MFINDIHVFLGTEIIKLSLSTKTFFQRCRQRKTCSRGDGRSVELEEERGHPNKETTLHFQINQVARTKKNLGIN